MPAASALSSAMKKQPSFPVEVACVPPHSSQEKSPILSILTSEPYFSENSMVAPIFLASSTLVTMVSTGMSSLIFSLTRASIAANSSTVSALGLWKSKRILSGET